MSMKIVLLFLNNHTVQPLKPDLRNLLRLIDNEFQEIL